MSQVTIDQAFSQAAALHRAGQAQAAEAIYRQILQINPAHADTLHLLGVLMLNSNRAEAAVELLRGAIMNRPRAAEFHYHLGLALARGNQIDGAIDAWTQATQIKPDFAEAHHNLGIALQMTGKIELAIGSFQQAAALNPRFAEAFDHLGMALQKLMRWDEAIAAGRSAVLLRPDIAQFHFNLASALQQSSQIAEAIGHYRQAIAIHPQYVEALNNLGAALQSHGDYSAAVDVLRRAVALQPGDAAAWFNLANALRELRQMDQAISAYQNAIKHQPAYSQAWINLADVFRAIGRINEATVAVTRGLELDQDHAEPHAVRGNILHDQLKIDEAISAYQRSLTLVPDHAAAHFNLGINFLLQGHFSKGWNEFEWRWKAQRHHLPQRPFFGLPWDGQPLNGQRILLYAEQGIGDTIQFARFAPIVARQGGKVILAAQPELFDLLKSLEGVEVVSLNDPLPQANLYCPLMSLPHRLGMNSDVQIPAKVPYLSADRFLVSYWENKLTPISKGRRIGLAWAGRPEHPNDRNRSLPFDALAALAELDRYHFTSLQSGSSAAQAMAYRDRFPIVDHTASLTTFAQTAGLMMNLDLVITVDTAIAHLAGALGKPVWVLLPYVPDWRWLLDRSDSPWYPTMRLFRQGAPGDWTAPLRQMAVLLQNTTITD